MASIRAKIKPSLLVWARESMNYSVEAAALKLGIKPDQLRQWESAEKAPTITQLRNAARVYKRPLAVFFLPEPPRSFDALRDFRRILDARHSRPSPQLAYEIRQARSRRDNLLEVAEETNVELPQFDANLQHLFEQPVSFAQEARRILNVRLDTQRNWRDGRVALNHWIRAFEQLGILVFRASDVPLEEMRGFAIHHTVLPVIVANGKDAYRGQIFTLLHEFAHLLLPQSALCDQQEYGESSTGDHRVEVFCNRVAGELLVPQAALEQELAGYARTGRNPQESTIEELATSFSVSKEVIVRRLLTIGRVGLAFYRQQRETYERVWRERRAQPSGYPQVHVLAVRDLGRLYVRTVMDAYHQEAITPADLAGYLDLKLKHLAKLEQYIYTGSEP